MELTRKYRVQLDSEQEHTACKILAVGQILRCESFRYGVRFNDDANITVGWGEPDLPDFHESIKNGTQLNDESRATAPFLVASINTTENSGPNDVHPEGRLAWDVVCWRLTDDLELDPNTETIVFTQFEPMSIVQPSIDMIEFLGIARFPIGYQDPHDESNG